MGVPGVTRVKCFKTWLGQHARNEALIFSRGNCLRRNLSLVTSAATIEFDFSHARFSGVGRRRRSSQNRFSGFLRPDSDVAFLRNR